MRILFAGTPEIAKVVLEALVGSEHKVVGVLTQPDKPAGRGQKIKMSPVKEIAQSFDIPVLQPESLKKNDAIQKELKAFKADLMVVVAYGLILPKNILDLPRRGCWNVHVSLLPRWRGAAPIQRAIEAGDRESGVCVMQMDAGLDTGDILHCLRCPIQPNETAEQLHDKLAYLGAQALVEALSDEAHLVPEKQEEECATYAAKLDKAEGLIDWTLSAQQVHNKIRAFNPWPVAFAKLDEQTIRIWQSEVLDATHNTTPGKIIDLSKDGIDVACRDGILRILQLQLPGKKVMSISDIINGHRKVFDQEGFKQFK